MKHIIFLIASLLLLMATACGGKQGQQKQDEQPKYYYWVYQQGEHKDAEILFVRMNDVFKGEYIDFDFPKNRVAIMGTIDSEGNVNGVSGVTSDDMILGLLKGKIIGDKFQAVWLPSPRMSDTQRFREMEMTKKEVSGEMKTDLDNIVFQAKTPHTEIAYGYSLGEQQRKHIHVGKGLKNGEVEFFLHLVESGINDIDITIHGFAPQNNNSFRYNEKGYEFEVTVYNGFITVKTISGDLDGVKADGVYPAPEMMVIGDEV